MNPAMPISAQMGWLYRSEDQTKITAFVLWCFLREYETGDPMMEKHFIRPPYFAFTMNTVSTTLEF